MTMIEKNHQNLILSTFINSTEATAKINILQPVQEWFDNLPIQNRQMAQLVAKLIPAQCPFERDIVLFGRTVAHIPPMCKLNPLYEQFVGLRFRALCYLVDECGEDIQSYC